MSLRKVWYLIVLQTISLPPCVPHTLNMYRYQLKICMCVCVTHSPFSYSCWNCSFTRLTHLEQALSPQIACKGSSKISQQKTHKKLCPDWARRGGVKRLEFKNSVFSATSVITEQVSSAPTACSVCHLDGPRRVKPFKPFLYLCLNNAYFIIH